MDWCQCVPLLSTHYSLNLSGFSSNLKELFFSQASSDHCSLNFNITTCSVTLSAPKHTKSEERNPYFLLSHKHPIWIKKQRYLINLSIVSGYWLFMLSFKFLLANYIFLWLHVKLVTFSMMLIKLWSQKPTISTLWCHSQSYSLCGWVIFDTMKHSLLFLPLQLPRSWIIHISSLIPTPILLLLHPCYQKNTVLQCLPLLLWIQY